MNIRNHIAKNNGRWHCPKLEELILLWEKAQHNYGISFMEFGKANRWPDVTSIFNRKVKQRLIDSLRYHSQANRKLEKYPQNSFNHVVSLCFLAAQVLAKVNPKLKTPLDTELLMKSFMIHNIAKGLGMRDLPYEKKTVQDDIKEYKAVKTFLKNQCAFASDQDRLLVEKIYLLQFCSGNIKAWPLVARNLMNACLRDYQLEVVWFKFLERLDYLIYAAEQYVRFENLELIAKIAKVQVPLIRSLKKDHPDLCRVWTPEVNDYFCGFIPAEQPAENSFTTIAV
jgi:hypothetical protein